MANILKQTFLPQIKLTRPFFSVLTSRIRTTDVYSFFSAGDIKVQRKRFIFSYLSSLQHGTHICMHLLRRQN